MPALSTPLNVTEYQAPLTIDGSGLNLTCGYSPSSSVPPTSLEVCWLLESSLPSNQTQSTDAIFKASLLRRPRVGALIKVSASGDIIEISGGISSKVMLSIIFDIPVFPAISAPSMLILYTALLTKLIC